MDITVCMGSSCFSRGNANNAEKIQEIMEKLGITDKVEFKGCLCEGECKKGPNIRINGNLYSSVFPEMIEDIITHELKCETGV